MTGAEVRELVGRMLRGEMDTPAIRDALMQIERDGVGAEQIAAGAAVMRENMVRVDVPNGAIDIVGTGGTGLKTLSISTATALVVAACGVPVAKHGNRGASSPAGTADTLSELGVDISMTPERASAAVGEIGIGFLYAPTYHPALRHVAAARKAIGTRTLFNRLGPLCNPGGVTNMLMGVAVRDELEPMAEALAEVPGMSAWVVRGRDGLDEITVTDATDVVIVEGGRCTPSTVDVEAMGLERQSLDALAGGAPDMNAHALRELLDSKRGAYRDIVLLNAAAALQIATHSMGWEEPMARAADAIDSGAAKAKLVELVAWSRG